MAGTALALCYYVVRMWREYRDTGSIDIGFGIAAAPGSLLYAVTRNRRFVGSEMGIRSPWLAYCWLALCVVVGATILAAAVAWLFVGAHWGSGSSATGGN
jgi:hypothetical protein